MNVNKNFDVEAQVEETKSYSEVEKIISDLDLNNLTPIQAFEILLDLKGKMNNGNN